MHQKIASLVPLLIESSGKHLPLAHGSSCVQAGAEAHHLLVPTGIYCCGLLSSRKSDCTGLPQSMLATTGGPPQRGQSRIKMNGDMSLISWYNKGHFRFLTNAYSPTKEGEARLTERRGTKNSQLGRDRTSGAPRSTGCLTPYTIQGE